MLQATPLLVSFVALLEYLYDFDTGFWKKAPPTRPFGITRSPEVAVAASVMIPEANVVVPVSTVTEPGEAPER
jgi:hypothetical protein